MPVASVKVLRRGLTAVVFLTGLSLVAITPPAQAYAPPFSSIVVDVNGKRVLHEESADQLRHPASLTKVMTLFLVFEKLRRGEIDLETPLVVSARAAGEPPTKVGVEAGSTITVEDSVKALVTRSANDVATVIAENLGGSVECFAQDMTRTARLIGMDRTVFRNAHGLPDPEQVTTARDLAILALSVQDRFPEYYRYFQTRDFQFAGVNYGNHNRLLGRVEGVDGIKTGFIRSSGFNLMTNAKSRSRHLVTIVLGGRTGAHRDQIVTGLVERHLPLAYSGPRKTPSTGFTRAAGHAAVAAPRLLPPVRPADLPPVMVAKVEPKADIAPFEAFASLGPPQASDAPGEAGAAHALRGSSLMQNPVEPDCSKAGATIATDPL
jgi:D-alanyl-D-alanine carboxypeptidase